jgi:microcystin-dependent protein
MSDAFLGEIRVFSGNFPPKNWALCNGQVLQISQNAALFAVIGNTYGGDGRSNFALPNLMDRVPIHWGEGSGLSNRAIGQTGGLTNVQLIETENPLHTHTPGVASGTGDQISKSPINGTWAVSSRREHLYSSSTTPNVQMVEQLLGFAGGSNGHSNQQPFLTLTYIIALVGVFPQRT